MEIKTGQKASIRKTFTLQEVQHFSDISLDSNKIHFDYEFAEKSIFGKPIVQGPLVSSLIGGILGTTLPGDGTIYMSQESNFKKPVFIGEAIVVNVEVIDIRTDKNIITLRTWVEKENGEIAIEGKAVVLLLK
ncbi:MAG: MaoC family dehydratase [Bacteroidia bacterium]|nr:MaoC family dehydratase [Bacteroidia bacterium]